ncbi:MAG: hypothetical protein ABFE08_13455 [Armatimonadia bacterium]
MRPFGTAETNSLRNVMAFTVLSHVLDLITTQWRDPGLNHEANPFYQFVEHFGYTGWPWLVSTKVVVVGALGLAYWWYLGVRHGYLPPKIVRSPRSLIWNGMWDGKPYPKSLWGRLFNRRKLSFLGMVLAGFALPGSGAAALFISLDNAAVALGRAIPIQLAGYFLLGTVGIVAVWFYWAYWHYYKTQVRAGLIPPE